jgi:hypothetical protein
MDLLSECADYINETIGVFPKSEMIPKAQGNKLPYFISDSYRLYSYSLLKCNFILLIPKDSQEHTPAELSKHADIVRKQLSMDVVVLLPELTGYNRKRMIGHKVPFIVPRKQLYLPDLMIDLREHFKGERENRREYLSPSAQVVLLYCIMQKRDALYPGDLATKLSYSRMTLNRAFDELAYFELAAKVFSGRDKLLKFSMGWKELWQKALPVLRSPVKKMVFFSTKPSGISQFHLSGISALAERSMIAEDKLPVYAVEWNSYQLMFRNGRIKEIPSHDEAVAAAELWHYSPGLLSNSNTVDPLSLYLSLHDSQDERIQSALDSMMEAVKW